MIAQRIFPASVLMIFFGCLVGTAATTAQAQENGGDQFLDGIGETALMARYLFDGDANDSSRNNRHATLHGSAATYVEDPQFEWVLSLPGESSGYVEIPGKVLVGIDTISVTGWILVGSTEPERMFFDFGCEGSAHCYCIPFGADADGGYVARITADDRTDEQGVSAPRIEANRWVHLGVVLDAARQTFSIYTNGIQVGQVASMPLDLEQLLDQNNASANWFSIGRSENDTEPGINAKVHDFRIYSIALTDRQIATIHRNALVGRDAIALEEETPGEIAPSNSPGSSPGSVSMFEALGLVDIPDITAETILGNLPRLPHFVEGTYPDAAGPMIRVIWPSPEDNRQVLQPGKYTVVGQVPGTSFQAKAHVTVRAASVTEPSPHQMLEAFPLGQVVLNQDEQESDTPFMKNRDKFVQGLAETDPDRFLYMFRDAFGQEQPEGVQPLGGWDSQTTKLRGHASGHYLSAIAQAYASTSYDEELQADFLLKMDYLIETLYDLSQKSGTPSHEGAEFNRDPTTVPPGPDRVGYDSNLSADEIRNDYWNWGEGFISAYPPDQFIMLEQGATYGGNENQIWAPYYTLHKILAGLLDCYEVGGNKKALEVAENMGLWVHARLEVVPTSTRISMWNRYIAGEYGGMNEVMARLFRLTEDQRFLECAQLFDNIDFFFGNAEHEHGLARNVDTLRGKHANQHIPQITGALETYAGTRYVPYYNVSENFWDICTHSYMYSIGGVAGARTPNNAECFTVEPNTLFANGFAPGGQNETCATYNMLKLSRRLFMFDPNGRYMDYYEQALYNHILASVAEGNPGNTYHVPLNPGSRKHFGNAGMDGFSCCNGTAMESSTKLQDSIYLKSVDNEALYVNLYVPSTVTWPERKVAVTQRTNFPYSDTTQLTIAGEGTFDINVRVPRWAARGFFVEINGEPQAVDVVPGSYLTLRRAWKENESIELRMPFEFYSSPIMDQPNIACIFYGPVLMAAEEPVPRTEWHRVTLDAEDIGRSINGDPSTLRFNIGDVRLRPFFEMYDRHSVYLNVTWE